MVGVVGLYRTVLVQVDDPGPGDYVCLLCYMYYGVQVQVTK